MSEDIEPNDAYDDVDCVVKTPDGIDVYTKYGFEVDSKGAVKPTFIAEVRRKLPSYNTDEDTYATIKKDANFLVALSQEILNNTPKAPK